MIELRLFDTGRVNADNLEFYRESLSIINEYLGVGKHSELIERLIESVKVEYTKNASSETSLLNEIETEISNIENSSIRGCYDEFEGGLYCNQHDKIDYVNFANRKSSFIKAIRNLILKFVQLGKRNVNIDKKMLSLYHIHTHLIELSMDTDKPIHARLREFLNINFTLKPDDLLGNLLRGNYVLIMKSFPELETAIAEYIEIKTQNISLSEWERKHNINIQVKNILLGRYKNFSNKTEEFLYKTEHGIFSDETDIFIEAIQGNFTSIIKNLMKDDNSALSYIRLIYLLVSPANLTICDFEKCFEVIFKDLYKFDNLLALGLLSYSRKCSFYFENLIDDFKIQNNIDRFIEYATENELYYLNLVRRYEKELIVLENFDCLCKFIIKYDLDDLELSRMAVSYFIDNFSNYSADIQYPLRGIFRFVDLIRCLKFLDEENLVFLINSRYFDYYISEISSSIISRSDASERLCFYLIEMLFKYENRTGISTKIIKSRIAQKLSSDQY